MTAPNSSFPQQRRDALLQQLREVRSRGDRREIARIELQWAHRYGVATLPEAAGTNDEVASSQMVQGAVADPGECLDPPAPEPRSEQREDPRPSPLARVKSVIRGCLDDVSSAVAPSAPRSAVQEADPSTIPLPPAPSLKRLRRWLPDASDDLPRAS